MYKSFHQRSVERLSLALSHFDCCSGYNERCPGGPVAYPDPKGAYVLYVDYVALERQLEALKEAFAAFEENFWGNTDY